MGARGPKPKPTALRVLNGNPSRRPLNDTEPRPIGEAAMPLHLTPEARDIWLTIVGSMPPGFYTAADEPLLTAFCEAAADHARATAALKDSPELVIEGKPNALLAIRNNAVRAMVPLATRLGLSPADRSGITCQGSGNSGNRWAALIGSARSSKG
ncbi:MAG: P27 family phage terminase small subunit [Defluviicoccus sp.]|nr:MAG: P27 family phage terminase small subunit [Defluviicoccus sp.]